MTDNRLYGPRVSLRTRHTQALYDIHRSLSNCIFNRLLSLNNINRLLSAYYLQYTCISHTLILLAIYMYITHLYYLQYACISHSYLQYTCISHILIIFAIYMYSIRLLAIYTCSIRLPSIYIYVIQHKLFVNIYETSCVGCLSSRSVTAGFTH